MNQTEIPRIHCDPENKNTLNIINRQPSKSTSRITVIKAGSYESKKQFTPKMQSSEKNSSSGKLVRINSSKGIKVTSSRPTSSEKLPKQFNETGNSFHGGSESTVKNEESSLLQKMREELRKVNRIYEQKMNQELSYQYNFMSIEIERLKEIIKNNDGVIAQLQLEVSLLSGRIAQVDKKTNGKMNELEKSINGFEEYFGKCSQYTVARVHDIEMKMGWLNSLVEERTSPIQLAIKYDEVQKAHDILERMAEVGKIRNLKLRSQIDDELFDFQIMLEKCRESIQNLDDTAYEMKLLKYGNEALGQTLKEAIDCHKVLFSSPISINKDKDEKGYEQIREKVKQLGKRIKSCEIQIQFMAALDDMDQSEKQNKSITNEEKVVEMSKIIDTLDKKIDEDKKWYLKQIQEKEEILVKANPRAIELEQRLKASYQLQSHLHSEISELNLKIAYLETKCSKFNEREYNIQTSLAQAFSESLVNEKTKKFQTEKQILNSKVNDLETKIKQLDQENYLLAQKMIQFTDSKSEIKKLSEEISFLTKLVQSQQKEKDEYFNQVQILKDKNLEIQQQVSALESLRDQLLKKKAISEEDELYMDELESEVERTMKEIQDLKNQIQTLKASNEQILEENKGLEDNLQVYAETFEKQSINFRNAIEKLQKEKDEIAEELKMCLKEKNIIQMDLQMSKNQSFYSDKSAVLRKTHSTQLSSPIMKKTGKKNLANLTRTIRNSGLPLPILCEIDQKGFLKHDNTSQYIADESDSLYKLSQDELAEAVGLGLILL